MSNRDRKNGVPATATSIPLVDPHAMPDNPSIGDLVRDATTQVSTLVRAEVELAKAEITRDVKKGLTGSVFFILALVVLLYSTFFMFFFLAELLSTWFWRWAAFLIVFILMLVVTAVFAFLGYRKVRRIRGPQQTIESVKETTAAITPSLAKFAGSPSSATATTTAPSRPAIRATTVTSPRPATAAAVITTDAAAAAPQATVEDIAYADGAEQVEYAYDAEQVEYQDAGQVEYAYDAEQVEYQDAGQVEYAYDAEQVEYQYGEYPEYAEPVEYPAGNDPTAAVYADTGLPVNTEYGAVAYAPSDDDRRPGGPSGW